MIYPIKGNTVHMKVQNSFNFNSFLSLTGSQLPKMGKK